MADELHNAYLESQADQIPELDEKQGLIFKQDKQGNVGPGMLPQALMDAYNSVKDTMEFKGLPSDNPNIGSNVLTMGGALAAGGAPLAEKGALGSAGGNLTAIHGGLAKHAELMDQLSETLAKSLKTGQPVPKELEGVVANLKTNSDAWSKELKGMLPPEPTKAELKRMGQTLEEWKNSIYESLDQEIKADLSVVKGGKAKPALENPIPVIENKELTTQLKEAQDLYAKAKQTKTEDPELIRHRGMLYGMLRRAAETEDLVRKNDKMLRDLHMPNTTTDESLRRSRDFLVEESKKLQQKIKELSNKPK